MTIRTGEGERPAPGRGAGGSVRRHRATVGSGGVTPAALLQRLTAFVQRGAPPASPEDARNRRAFVQDMMARNPDTFASDLEVQVMMQHYPAHF